MDSSIDQVREQALANFDALLYYWKLEYKKISTYEYDIIASWRKDNDFGGCRFNIQKARGADFAGGGLNKSDFEDLSVLLPAFDKEDYAGYTNNGQGKIGFDIVGLAQRVHKCPNYVSAVGLLNKDLNILGQYKTLRTASLDAAIRREREHKLRVKKSKQLAHDMWGSCNFHSFEGSVAEKYLSNRGIKITDKNMRCHPGAVLRGTKYPVLLFKVQREPSGPLVAIHRIFLSENGYKAKIDNPKMALAPIKGNGIWLGEKNETLHLAEGPENALTLVQFGCDFVCSSIFSGNLHNLFIPNYVKKLSIWPDPDKAGLMAAEAAKSTYSKLGIEIEIEIPEDGLDLNDHLMKLLRGNNG